MRPARRAVTYGDFVRLIKAAVGGRARVSGCARRGSRSVLRRAAGLGLRDVVVTRDELDALLRGCSSRDEPPRGQDRFDAWLAESHGRSASLHVGAATELPRLWLIASRAPATIAARVDVAAAAGHPRAAAHPVRGGGAVVRRARPARRRPCRARARARRRQGSLGAPTGGRSRWASTRPCTSTAASTARRRTRATPRGCSRELSGRTHTVLSGICLLAPGSEVVEHAATGGHVPGRSPVRDRHVPRQRRVGGARRCLRGPGARRASRGRASTATTSTWSACPVLCWWSCSRGTHLSCCCAS